AEGAEDQSEVVESGDIIRSERKRAPETSERLVVAVELVERRPVVEIQFERVRATSDGLTKRCCGLLVAAEATERGALGRQRGNVVRSPRQQLAVALQSLIEQALRSQ